VKENEHTTPLHQAPLDTMVSHIHPWNLLPYIDTLMLSSWLL